MSEIPSDCGNIVLDLRLALRPAKLDLAQQFHLEMANEIS